jgi:hypothetical protein
MNFETALGSRAIAFLKTELMLVADTRRNSALLYSNCLFIGTSRQVSNVRFAHRNRAMAAQPY